MNYLEKSINEMIIKLTKEYEKELLETKEMKEIINKQLKIEDRLIDALKTDELVETLFNFHELANKRESKYIMFFFIKGLEFGIIIAFKIIKLFKNV